MTCGCKRQHYLYILRYFRYKLVTGMNGSTCNINLMGKAFLVLQNFNKPQIKSFDFKICHSYQVLHAEKLLLHTYIMSKPNKDKIVTFKSFIVHKSNLMGTYEPMNDQMTRRRLCWFLLGKSQIIIIDYI